MFAIRIPIESPKERLRHGVQVDDGVCGLLIRNGTVEAELSPGYNEMTTFLGRLFGGSKPSGTLEAIVVTTQPVDVLVDFGPRSGIRTRDSVPLEGAVMLTVEVGDLNTFRRSMFSYGVELVRDDELAKDVVARVGEVLRRHAGARSVEAIAGDLDARSVLEAELGKELPLLFQRSGLKLCGVKDVRFSGAELDRCQTQAEDLGSTERDNQWAVEKRRLTQTGELSRIQDESEFNERVAEISYAFGLNQKERDYLMALKDIHHQGELGVAAARAKGSVQLVETELELTRRRMKAESEREQDEYDLALADRLRKGNIALKRELDQVKADAQRRELDNQAAFVNSISSAPVHALLAVTDPEKGKLIVEAVRAMNPEPRVLMQPTDASGRMFIPRYASSFMDLAHRLVHGVGVVVVQLPGGKLKACGTAWIAKGHGVLVTNAHVAEPVLQAYEEARLSSCVMFPGGSLAISGIELHPRYQAGDRLQILPGYDVAVLQVQGSLPHEGLPVASRAKALSLMQAQPVAYLGYPGEGLAGGGVNLDRPKAMAKPGHITALTDWLLRDVPSENAQLVQHDIGVAGGASGSPLLNDEGEVVGIVSAGNMQVSVDAQTQAVVRSPSAAMVNFAQRIDVLTDWAGW